MSSLKNEAESEEDYSVKRILKLFQEQSALTRRISLEEAKFEDVQEKIDENDEKEESRRYELKTAETRGRELTRFISMVNRRCEESDNEVNSLRADDATLRKDVERLKGEFSVVSSQLENINNSERKLLFKLDEADTEGKKLMEADSHAAAAQLQTLTEIESLYFVGKVDIVAAAPSLLIDEERKLKTLRRNIADTERSITENRSAESIAKWTLADCTSQLEVARTDERTLEQRLRDAKNDLGPTEESVAKVETEIRSLTSKQKECQQKFEELMSKSIAAREVSTKAQNELDEAETQIDVIGDLKSFFEQLLTTQEQKFRFLKLDSQASQASKDLIQKSISEIQSLVASVKEKLTSFSKDALRNLKDISKKRRQELSKILGELHRAKGDLESTEAELSTKNGELVSKKDKLLVQKQVIEEAQIRLKSLKSRIAELTKVQAQCEEDVRKYADQIQNITELLKMMKSEEREAVANSERTNMQASAKLAEARRRVIEVGERQNLSPTPETLAQIKERTELAATLRKELLGTRGRLRIKNQEIDDIGEELGKVLAEKVNLTEKLQALRMQLLHKEAAEERAAAILKAKQQFQTIEQERRKAIEASLNEVNQRILEMKNRGEFIKTESEGLSKENGKREEEIGRLTNLLEELKRNVIQLRREIIKRPSQSFQFRAEWRSLVL